MGLTCPHVFYLVVQLLRGSISLVSAHVKESLLRFPENNA